MGLIHEDGLSGIIGMENIDQSDNENLLYVKTDG
jgi:hypothetical protein